MNAKIKLLTITLVSLFSCVLAGCGNSSTKQETETTQQENFLVTVFKETLAKKESFFELIRKDAVKERIINEYSQNFYDKLCQQVHVSSPISYTDGKYEGYGTGGRYGNGEANLSYTPANDILTINFTIGGETIQRDGEVHYNTEGWDIDVYEEKNDFNEVVNREPVSAYLIAGKEYTYSKYKFALVMRLNYITLWTNENDMSEIKDIRVKDHDSGRIYNIAFDQEHYVKNGGAMNSDVGVVMFGKNAGDFINLISSLNNYTISIRSKYYDNAVILTNPENFNNIKDVFMQLLRNQESMSKSN